MRLDEGGNIGLEFGRGAAHPALQLLPGQLSELAFDLVDPTGRGGREVHMPVRAARQPGLDLRGLVGGVIVHHQMYLRSLRHCCVDPFQEVQKLRRPVALVAFADYRPCGNVERRKERGRPVADEGVGPTFRHAGSHRQDGLLAIQCLDLGFLIYSQDDSPVWWRQVQADDVLYLVHEEWVAGELECLAPVRLQSEGIPDPTDCRVRQHRLHRNASDQPNSDIVRCRVQRALDHLGNLRVGDGARATRSVLVGQACNLIPG